MSQIAQATYCCLYPWLRSLAGEHTGQHLGKIYRFALGHADVSPVLHSGVSNPAASTQEQEVALTESVPDPAGYSLGLVAIFSALQILAAYLTPW